MSNRKSFEDPECRRLRPLLEDFVDGELTGERRTAVRRHLERCEGCRREAEAIECLVAAARELPSSVEPGHDLWPGVAARLKKRSPASRRRAGGRRTGGRRTGWIPQAVAATLLVAFGAILGQLLWPSASPRSAARTGEPAAELPARERRAEMASAEAEILRVKESLWLAVYRQRALLSPMTIEVVEANLKTVDDAIREIHEALDEDPGNRQLEGLLLAHHRRGVHLLRRLADVSEEI